MSQKRNAQAPISSSPEFSMYRSSEKLGERGSTTSNNFRVLVPACAEAEKFPSTVLILGAEAVEAMSVLSKAILKVASGGGAALSNGAMGGDRQYCSVFTQGLAYRSCDRRLS
jgi:hypothetical protein